MLKRIKEPSWCFWKDLSVYPLVMIVILLHVDLISSKEVCEKHIDEDECPSNTCCKQDICNDKNAEGRRNTKADYKCCSDINESEECSNCPACIPCEWAEWGECHYKTCGDGEGPRTVTGLRHRKHAYPGNGATCPGEAQEWCPHKQCPVDCEYERWGSWSTCSGGTRYRERETKTQAQNNGNPCPGKAFKRESCNTVTSTTGWFVIKSKHSEMVLDIEEARRGGNVITYQKHGGENQLWKWKDGAIVSKLGYALDVKDGNPEAVTNVISWELHGGPNQQWRMEGDKLISELNGLALDISGGSKDSNIEIIVWPLKSADEVDNQSWELEYE